MQMKFEVTFAIEPSGPFGVPQEGMTVLRGQAGEYVGDTYHTNTMTRVGYGALPEYRSDDEAIRMTFVLEQARISLRDNFLFLEIESASPQEASDQSMRIVNNFLRHLSLSRGQLFTAETLIIESDGKVFPVPRYVRIAHVTHYNLEQLKLGIEEAESYYFLADQRLSRALEYYEQALLLFAKREQIAQPLSRNYGQVIASVFLNLWKALSVVVGDPSRPEDSDYQSRYKKLGFDYTFFKDKIEKVRDLRNSYDVAHYSLSEQDINEVDANFGIAHEVTAEVLQRYREYLMSQTQA